MPGSADRPDDAATCVVPPTLTAPASAPASGPVVDLIQLPIGIFVTTRVGDVRFTNVAMRRMLRIPPDRPLAEISPVANRTFDFADRERFWRGLEAEGAVSGFETTFTRYDGEVIDVELNARLRDGERGVCEGSAVDISARKAAERRLHELSRRWADASRELGRNEEAGHVLHNVGNVLTSVNLMLHDMHDCVRESRIGHLRQLAGRIEREMPRLGDFLSADPVGRQLPAFLLRVTEQLHAENQRLLSDLGTLEKHCRGIRDIIARRDTVAGPRPAARDD